MTNKITVNVVALDVSEDRLGSFLAQYGQVEEVTATISKAGIATGDFVLKVTSTRNSFG